MKVTMTQDLNDHSVAWTVVNEDGSTLSGYDDSRELARQAIKQAAAYFDSLVGADE